MSARESAVRSERRWRALRIVLAVVICAVLIFPLYWMVVVSFSSRIELVAGDLRLWPAQWTTENFERVFTAFPIATWFGNSVAISLVTALISVAINLLGDGLRDALDPRMAKDT